MLAVSNIYLRTIFTAAACEKKGALDKQGLEYTRLQRGRKRVGSCVGRGKVMSNETSCKTSSPSLTSLARVLSNEWKNSSDGKYDAGMQIRVEINGYLTIIFDSLARRSSVLCCIYHSWTGLRMFSHM